MNLHTICDTVILIGAVVLAISNILKFLGKPASYVKKQKAEMKEWVEVIIKEYIESYEMQQKTACKFFQEEVKQQILKDIKQDLDEIKHDNHSQSEIIDLLRKQAIDVLRQKIERIYYEYRNEKALPRFEKENLEELYEDYVKGGGNHHIHKLYMRMQAWNITEELPEYDRE